ncbi:hypothetical protein CBL_20309 [Carabus blaptoides fortunei]
MRKEIREQKATDLYITLTREGKDVLLYTLIVKNESALQKSVYIAMVYDISTTTNQMSCNGKYEFMEVFAEAQVQYPNAAQNLGGNNSMKSMMKRSRQAGTPGIPDNVRQFCAILEDPRWREKYATELGAGQMPFFYGLVEHPNIWIFVQYLRHVEHMKACDFEQVFFQTTGLESDDPNTDAWMNALNPRKTNLMEMETCAGS